MKRRINYSILGKMTNEFKIEGEYIKLTSLLKATGIASTGGHAKMLVDSHSVTRNGEVETRKGAKIIIGDTIEIDGNTIKLV